MMNFFNKFKWNNKGSTMVEVLVGFTILVLVVVECMVHIVGMSNEMVKNSKDLVNDIHTLNEQMYTKDVLSTNNTDFVDDDSLQIAKIVNNVSNPVFTSLEDVMIYQKKIKEQHLSDSIINHVDPDILSFIADVCINRDGYTTPKKILEEYKAYYKDVYQNVKLTDITESKENTQKDKHSEDTVIKGKRWQLIKEKEDGID